MDKKILSKSADYQKLEVLKTNRNKRYSYNEFIVEGVRNINEAVKNGWRFSSLIYADGGDLSDWAKNVIKSVKTDCKLILAPNLMKELSAKEDTSELMAVIKMREDSLDKIKLSGKPFIVLFDRPSNKGNLGTIIRSCDALGADCLIITGHAVDLYDPEVITAGMGSFFNLPVIRITDNKSLDGILQGFKTKYPDFKVIGTTAHKKTPLYDEKLDSPCMVMVGNETEGLSNYFYTLTDTLVTIPMAETSYASSFNVACAATVIMYEIVRQRKE